MTHTLHRDAFPEPHDIDPRRSPAGARSPLSRRRPLGTGGCPGPSSRDAGEPSAESRGRCAWSAIQPGWPLGQLSASSTLASSMSLPAPSRPHEQRPAAARVPPRILARVLPPARRRTTTDTFKRARRFTWRRISIHGTLPAHGADALVSAYCTWRDSCRSSQEGGNADRPLRNREQWPFLSSSLPAFLRGCSGDLATSRYVHFLASDHLAKH